MNITRLEKLSSKIEKSFYSHAKNRFDGNETLRQSVRYAVKSSKLFKKLRECQAFLADLEDLNEVLA